MTANHALSMVSIKGKSNVKLDVLSGCTYPTKRIYKASVQLRDKVVLLVYGCTGGRDLR